MMSTLQLPGALVQKCLWMPLELNGSTSLLLKLVCWSVEAGLFPTCATGTEIEIVLKLMYTIRTETLTWTVPTHCFLLILCDETYRYQTMKMMLAVLHQSFWGWESSHPPLDPLMAVGAQPHAVEGTTGAPH